MYDGLLPYKYTRLGAIEYNNSILRERARELKALVCLYHFFLSLFSQLTHIDGVMRKSKKKKKHLSKERTRATIIIILCGTRVPWAALQVRWNEKTFFSSNVYEISIRKSESKTVNYCALFRYTGVGLGEEKNRLRTLISDNENGTATEILSTLIDHESSKRKSTYIADWISQTETQA